MILLTNMALNYIDYHCMHVHVPQVGSIVSTCTCKLVVLVVLCAHVPQVGGIVCTCTSGW